MRPLCGEPTVRASLRFGWNSVTRPAPTAVVGSPNETGQSEGSRQAVRKPSREWRRVSLISAGRASARPRDPELAPLRASRARPCRRRRAAAGRSVPPCMRAMRSTIARPSPAPAAPSARARAADRARERLLQPLDLVGRDAGAAVGDVEHERVARRARRDLDRRRAVGERVVDEVRDEPRDRGRLAAAAAARRRARTRTVAAGAARSASTHAATIAFEVARLAAPSCRRRARSRGTGR